MKVIHIVGTRPQLVKLSIVSKRIKEQGVLEQQVIDTGQHYNKNLVDVFYRDLEMSRPDFNLEVGSLSHGAQTGRMLEKVENCLQEIKPDGVIVYGDTNSTLAGALATSKIHIPLFHIEAGLRSYNRKMPEEINRIVTDHLSDYCFVPTKNAIDNLIREGIPLEKIFNFGDVMFDVSLEYGKKAENKSRILDILQLDPESYVLATIHRSENTNDRGLLHKIFNALEMVSKRIPIVMPLHPRTKRILESQNLKNYNEKVSKVIEPVGYLDMLMLLKNSKLILTDSGGVQKEAYFYKRPCLTLRNETEWKELLEIGWNKLVDLNVSDNKIAQFITDNMEFIGTRDEVYGSGNASKRIAETIASLL